MIRIRTLSAGATVGLMLAAGLAFAQGGLMPNLPDREVIAAQDALEEAMAHLQNARNPSSPAVTRAKAYIALAHTELGPTGGAQGLQLNPE